MILKNQAVVLTGGAGFLGRFVFKKLKEQGVLEPNILVPRSRNLDLKEKENCIKIVRDADIVIHLAANVGGIGYNQKYPNFRRFLIDQSQKLFPYFRIFPPTSRC